jgi:negative regulator of genetic competence, sporulation and motility
MKEVGEEFLMVVLDTGVWIGEPLGEASYMIKVSSLSELIEICSIVRLGLQRFGKSSYQEGEVISSAYKLGGSYYLNVQGVDGNILFVAYVGEFAEIGSISGYELVFFKEHGEVLVGEKALVKLGGL